MGYIAYPMVCIAPRCRYIGVMISVPKAVTRIESQAVQKAVSYVVGSCDHIKSARSRSPQSHTHRIIPKVSNSETTVIRRNPSLTRLIFFAPKF